MSESKQNKLKNWLATLQQESWQLELIISGFAIFLIIGMAEPLRELVNFGFKLSLESKRFNFLVIPILCLQGAWFTLILNLLVHLVMRGLWISTIGLRYVSEDIDFEQLRMAKPFHNYLSRRIKSFDHYIERLEKICSVIFAFSFLLIFVILSVSCFYLFSRLTDMSFQVLFRDNWSAGASALRSLINVALFFMGFIYFLDFLSLGRIKRIKWFSRLYYPIYRFMSWITLASIYRPIYYNLIDNKFGRRIGWLILPYILVALIGSSLNIQSGQYFPVSSPFHLEDIYYDEKLEEGVPMTLEIAQPSIPSKYVENGYLELFLPYLGILDGPSIEHFCPGLVAGKVEKIYLDGAVKLNFSQQPDYNLDSIMTCFANLHKIRINGELIEDLDFMIYEHPQKDVMGFLSIIDVDTLSRGKNVLSIEKYGLNFSINQMQRKWQEPINIPFWKVD